MISFDNFVLNERLHINKDVDKFGDYVYDVLEKNKNKIITITENIPSKLNISKLIIKRINKSNVLGELNINDSKKLKDNSWQIVINLNDREGIDIDTIKHELNHAMRLTLIGKDAVLKNINYLKIKTYFINLHNEKINQFFEYLYLASEEELNARVIQVYSHIKELCKKNKIKKLNKETFNYIIENTPDYIYADHLSKFNCVEHFKGFNKNKLNKFFYLFDREKKKLDEMSKKKFFTIRIIIKIITDMMKNELEISDDDLYIYKPRKDADYYTKYINKQGERLKRRLRRLYLHFNENIQ